MPAETPFATYLTEQGYTFDTTRRIWHRPAYAGIAYSDGTETEERIAGLVAAAADPSVLSADLRRGSTDWPTTYHLAATRANVLRPMAALLTGDVLEIGAGCGAITRYLGETGAQVLALEGSPRRAGIARSRSRDLANVTVVAERFDDFPVGRTFDVVTLIGVFEYANLFTPGANAPLSMLKRVRALLKPHGRLILAIENQFGLKYFAGAAEDHVGAPMFGIEDRYTDRSVRTFGKRELDELLAAAGFAGRDFLSCFPDYKLPSSIVTEAGCRHPAFDAGALAWQSTAKDRLKPEFACFASEVVWPKIMTNGLGLDLANSFLVCCSVDGAASIDPQILGYHYSSERLPRFAKEATFRAAGESVSVHYQSLTEPGAELAAAAQVGTGELRYAVPKTQPYAFGTPLSWDYVRLVTRPGWTFAELGTYLKRYLAILAAEAQLPAPLTPADAVAGRYLDCIPNNLICKPDGAVAAIDTEWAYSQEIGVRRMLFRALLGVAFSTTDVAPDGDGQRYTFVDLFLKAFAAAGFPATAADLAGWFRDEVALQQAVVGVPMDFAEQFKNLEHLTPRRKYPDVTAGFVQELQRRAEVIADQGARLDAQHTELMRLREQAAENAWRVEALTNEVASIKGSKKYRLANMIANATPQFLRSKL